MAVCEIQSVVSLKVDDIKSSVASYMGSLRFLRKLIPISTINIIFNRINMKASWFAKRNVVGVEFMVFDPKAKTQIGSDMRHWTKGAAEALEKQYLREFYLIFKDRITGNIVENYKFSFTYVEKSSSSLLPTSEEVVKATKTFLHNIEQLSSFDKLPEETEVFVEITMMDGTPFDYNPPNYGRVTTRPLILDLPITDVNRCVKLGELNTGFHKIKLRGVADSFYAAPSSKSGRTGDDIDDMEQEINQPVLKVKSENKDLAQPSIDDAYDMEITNINPHEETSIDDNLSCHCGVYVVIKSIENIMCSICGKYKHSPCCGYEQVASVPDPYVCIDCNSKKHPATDTLLLMQVYNKRVSIVSFLRLFTYYCLNYKIVPKVLLDNIDPDMRDGIFKKLVSLSFLREDNNKLIINFVKVKSFMVHMFYQLTSPDSMLLDDEEGPIIIELE